MSAAQAAGAAHVDLPPGTTADPALADWFDRAGVRTDTRHLLGPAATVPEQLAAGRTFFPEHLLRYLRHPLVQALAPEERNVLAARHLYHYLSFTAHFETQVVNRVTARIAAGGADVDVPIAARVDALKIYTDEGWHALYSLDLVRQLEDATRIPVLPYDFRPYLRRLDAVGDEVMPGRVILAQLLQVVVFETSVTSVLRSVPADPAVLDVVRETVADHARDEGRHHSYFAAFFRHLWNGLEPADRAAAARCLPVLIRRSLEPDTGPLRRALVAAGLDPQQAGTVVAESIGDADVDADIARDARHTVRLFRDCGVLDVPGGLDAFLEARLLDRGEGR